MINVVLNPYQNFLLEFQKANVLDDEDKTLILRSKTLTKENVELSKVHIDKVQNYINDHKSDPDFEKSPFWDKLNEIIQFSKSRSNESKVDKRIISGITMNIAEQRTLKDVICETQSIKSSKKQLGTFSWKSSLSSYQHTKQVSPREEQKKTSFFESSNKVAAMPTIDRSIREE